MSAFPSWMDRSRGMPLVLAKVSATNSKLDALPSGPMAWKVISARRVTPLKPAVEIAFSFTASVPMPSLSKSVLHRPKSKSLSGSAVQVTGRSICGS